METAARARFTNLDVLKGICLIFVIITHTFDPDEEKNRYFFPFWVTTAVPLLMIVSGYLFSFSVRKACKRSLTEWYTLPNLAARILRFTVPFAIAFLVEMTVMIALGLQDPNPLKLVYHFLRGGIGAGSYYFPIMIQFIFYFPVVYYIVNRYDWKGFLGCFALNFVYELLKTDYMMNYECYRLLLFRYTAAIGFGCLLALHGDKVKRGWLLLGCPVGIAYLILVKYLGVTPVLTAYWSATSFVALLYVLPFAQTFFNHKNIHCKPLEAVGEASFNVFLVQMLYFNNGTLRFVTVENRLLQTFLNVLLCCVLGIVFYHLEAPLTRWVKQKVLSLLDRATARKPA